MKIFVFGAGASRGSQGKNFSGLKSPLVDDFFTGTYKAVLDGIDFLPHYRREIDGLNEEKKKCNSLEIALTSRWDQITRQPSINHQEAEKSFFGFCVYYIWSFLKDISNTYSSADNENFYKAFLNKLYAQKEPFGIINFNYDTLLDQAYQEVFNASLVSIQKYKDLNFIKPHGSVNWFLNPKGNEYIKFYESEINTQAPLLYATSLVFEARSLEESLIARPDSPDIRSPSFLVGRNFNSQFGIPLILLPLSSKQYSHIAGFSEGIIDKGRALLAGAKEIYLIGYKASDDVIHEMLENTPVGCLLHVINQGSAKEIMDNVLAKHKQLKKGSMCDGGFEDFVSRY